MAKTPDPIDVEVGSKIKAQRRLRGMSQDTLAAALGVTFQQIQKYEKGTNRVSSSRLAVIAKTFGVPPSYFFPGADDTGQGMVAAAPELASFLETNEGRDLNLAFSRISSHRMRRKVVGLVTALADAFRREDVSDT
ncbi:helix-turn-helix transcriptional regulator (plasmid) [Nitratireductor rhodophyticola]|jgi:transcriptional regulator with XRE-family HTH domain|uniref:Helix-turn-helix transcriptional regulator n=1 Tax=Sphingobium cyanobacteriorum TaxID=3063954 RepID=A0ABT8ZST3_9SPHN|nr:MULTISPECIES: helix-turn-helix transcriptional regulator [Alphaproteobacteria]MDO7837587.1 helix-turn-helix transcriptional regulator [Sphingobium sp. HBC34]PKP70351.1 MAG: transcriptional regulator [Alphaproteobacteria bacterium HGW-Alphaproteobacteria-5]WPZ16446.1 helix-turn-helix transcriptional regulator [Nitratireductor rhodophyticola]